MKTHDEIAKQMGDSVKQILSKLVKGSDKDLLEYVAQIEFDMLQCALELDDKLYEEQVAQLCLVRGVARGRISDRAREALGVVLKGVIGAVRVALL